MDQPGAPEAPSFLHLLQGLVFEAQLQLGIVPHPIGGQRLRQLQKARITVRLLELIAEKTRGNLTAEEDEYLRGALAGLRRHLAQSDAGAGPAAGA